MRLHYSGAADFSGHFPQDNLAVVHPADCPLRNRPAHRISGVTVSMFVNAGEVMRQTPSLTDFLLYAMICNNRNSNASVTA